MKTVSVVIPSYNHDKYIHMAVESVLSQSYSDIELIVIDDGSTDDSLCYLRSISDNRFVLIEQDNSGAHQAINRGLEIAQGEYLAILNSDDIFHQDRIMHSLERLNAGVDLVASWLEIVDCRGKILGLKKAWQNMLPWAVGQPTMAFTGTDAFAANLLQSNFVSTTSNIIFSRKLYESIGGMKNLRFCHDWDFLLRAAKDFHCEVIERPLLQYRIHSKNTISSDRQWMLFEICWIYAVHLGVLMKNIFPVTPNEGGIEDPIHFMGGCINLQGNDKVMWLIQQFIEQKKRAGILNSEHLLLSNEKLRKSFIGYIV